MSRSLPKCFVLYWKTFVLVLTPLVFLPIPLVHIGDKAYLCIYVFLIMATYWIAEVIPLVVTALLPIALFPLMGIMSTDEICDVFSKDTSLMFIASLFLSEAIVQVNLHKRIALQTISCIGNSIRKLSLGLMFVTLFLSMWISSTAATALMVPIALAIVEHLEMQGLMRVYEDVKLTEDEPPIPSKVTNLFMIGIAYSATVGGAGSLYGTPTNLALKGIYEDNFPDAPAIGFGSFFLYSAPVACIIGVLLWTYLNIRFTGMMLPKKKNQKEELDLTKDAEGQVIEVIQERVIDLGPMKTRERLVLALIILLVMFWFFRYPGFMKGWPKLFCTIRISNTTPTCFVIILLFILPSDWSWTSFCSAKDKRKTISPSILSWDLIEKRTPWSMFLLVGSGLVLSVAAKRSGMSYLVGSWLTDLKDLPTIVLSFCICLTCQLITELSSSIGMTSVALPILAQLAVQIKIHPLRIMLPAAISCSYAFLLPVGSPQNAFISGVAHIRTFEMLKNGFVAIVITLIINVGAFELYGPAIFSDLKKFPAWSLIRDD